jgi:hypothetical protein
LDTKDTHAWILQRYQLVFDACLPVATSNSHTAAAAAVTNRISHDGLESAACLAAAGQSSQSRAHDIMKCLLSH